MVDVGATEVGRAGRLLTAGRALAAAVALLSALAPAQLRAGERPDLEPAGFGQDVVVAAGDNVVSAFCLGCDVVVHGQVGEDVVTLGGSIEVEGQVGGDAVAVGGDVRLGPRGRIGGDAIGLGGEVNRADGAMVGGETHAVGWFRPSALVVAAAVAVLATLLLNLVLALVTYGLAGRERLERTLLAMGRGPALVLLAGAGVVAAAVGLFVLSAWLGPVGPWLVLAASLALLVLLVFGYTALSYGLGRRLGRRLGPVTAVLVGAFLLTLLQAVPLLGLLLAVVLVLHALGGAFASGLGRWPDWLRRRLASPDAAARP